VRADLEQKMTNPIRGVDPIDVSGAASTGGPGSQPAVPPKLQTDAAAVDSADLSRAHALLTTISQAAATIPSVDRTLVGQLQEALNSGSYRANPQLIAEKIMEIESLLSSDNSPG
jgi:flagellar biosynthesis anti-sigma factor FlgM